MGVGLGRCRERGEGEGGGGGGEMWMCARRSHPPLCARSEGMPCLLRWQRGAAVAAGCCGGSGVLRWQRGAAVAAGRGCPAACMSYTVLSQAVIRSLFFAFLHLVLCSRALGFPDVHSAVKQTYN
jgi:hypothetical protein